MEAVAGSGAEEGGKVMAESLQCDRCKEARAGHVKRYMDTVVGVTATGWEFVLNKLLCSRCIDALRVWLAEEGPK